MKRPILCGTPQCISVEAVLLGKHSAIHIDSTASVSISSVGSKSHIDDKNNEVLQLSENDKSTMRRKMLTTPVFVSDDVLVWRPAELLKKQLLPLDDDSDDNTVNVTLSHVPSMDYTLDFHKRVIAPKQYVSPFRSKASRQSCSDSVSDVDSVSVFSTITMDESLDGSTCVDRTSYEGGKLPLQDVDANGETILRDNLSDLPYLHEASILYNLAGRNEKGIPYTRAGDVIVAINPFKWINGLYSERKRELYSDHFVWYPKRGDLNSIAPHVYEASSLAYRGMVIDGRNQSVIVSGETGAGKTETVKILMSHLATFGSKKILPAEEERLDVDDVETSKKKSRFGYRPHFFRFKKEKEIKHQPKQIAHVQNNNLDSETNLHDNISDVTDFMSDQPEKLSKLNLIVQRVLDADVLLEAFGNAKTMRNDNSSRFSKYTRLQFHVKFMGHATPSCTLAGSYCSTYLLQKSRVVKRDSEVGERSFHIFYQLLSASEEEKTSFWKGLGGKDVESFKYIGTPSTDTIEGMDDASRWKETISAFEIFGITGEKLNTLFRALSAVLQLGNLTFGVDPENEDGSVIISTDELEKCSDILGVRADVLEAAFTSRKVVAPDVTFSVPVTSSTAKDNCDAFAKSIYSMSFDWLVRAINETTCAEDNYLDGSLKTHLFPTIGLLDIFGFETFPKNYFEQMCINHANEKLQHKFIEDVFCSVQEEYESEGISLQEIKYEDNMNVLSLIENRLGLIDLLNEECFRPKGSDSGFVHKIYTNARGQRTPLYRRRDFQRYEFGIKHFAGPVRYDATEFVTKNMDNIPPQVVEFAVQSTNDLIRTAFMKRTVSKRSVKADTVWKRFNTQMTSLLQEIKKTDTRYIRCIVPNKEKLASKTDLKYTINQLRCAGVMSAVTISRAAFPNRMAKEIALDRFSILAKKSKPLKSSPSKKSKKQPNIVLDLDTILDNILKSMEKVGDDGKVKKAYICGKTKVYFRGGALEYLEEQRLLAFEKMAIVIQCWIRRRRAVTEVEKLRSLAKGGRSHKFKYNPRSFYKKLKKVGSKKPKSSKKRWSM